MEIRIQSGLLLGWRGVVVGGMVASDTTGGMVAGDSSTLFWVLFSLLWMAMILAMGWCV